MRRRGIHLQFFKALTVTLKTTLKAVDETLAGGTQFCPAALYGFLNFTEMSSIFTDNKSVKCNKVCILPP